MQKRLTSPVECRVVELQGVRYAILPERVLRELCVVAGREPSVQPPAPPMPEVELDRRRLAERIALRRKRAGLSQAELARRAGLRAETLNRIERGKADPDFSTIRKLVIAMNEVEAALPNT